MPPAPVTGPVKLHWYDAPGASTTPGVTSQLGLENPNDRPVLPNAGKTERYQPRVQPASLVVTAAPDAPLSDAPATVRVVARPVRDDGLGDPIATADLLLLVVDQKKTEKK